ncbi:MAG: histidine--tRNA ligase [Desulfovibrionaceae bacterium]|nr:histidine--tRNA ligase [Desulfovibrionaceae bacterium]
MSNTPTAIKGFADMFSPDSDAFTKMEAVARELFSRYGYTELRTPILEYTELFKRGIGTETDVVQKEMYTFPDRHGRSLTMRPEATAGVMRACIEHARASADSVTKVFTIGPMFRYERPQKGRLRQFHQINCECLGPVEPYADAELLVMAVRFLEALGLKDLTLHLNALGCPQCRPAYREALRNWLRQLDADALCEDCRRRTETNPLRVLDCKVSSCKSLTENAPKITDHLCPDCEEHFAQVRRLLDAEHIEYVLDHRLVRGLDYYTRTTFEIVSDAIGAQGTVAGGGRYDGLVSQLGGGEVSGLGFACGMERLALLLPETEAPRPDFYIVTLNGVGSDGRTAAFSLAQSLRNAGLKGEMGFSTRSVKSAMRQAGKSHAHCCLLIGEQELADGTAVIKDMDSGEQAALPLADAAARIRTLIASHSDRA